jgi:SynChlorMet cassette protein ScmA
MTEKAKGKPTYEAPKLIPLGELAKGEGQSCHSGGSASNCSVGGNASNNCNTGSTAGNRCGFGQTPGSCRLGLGAVLGCRIGFGVG